MLFGWYLWFRVGKIPWFNLIELKNIFNFVEGWFLCQDFIVLFDLFSSKFKEDASVSRAVDIQKLCIVFQNFTVVVILVISRLGKFSFALASVLVPLHDFFVCIEVVLLEFVYEEALVVGELGFIKEVRLPHSSDQIHNVSLSLKVLNTVVVEV